MYNETKLHDKKKMLTIEKNVNYKQHLLCTF